MTLGRIVTSICLQRFVCRATSSNTFRYQQNLVFKVTNVRFLSEHRITKNIEFISNDRQVVVNNNTVQCMKESSNRPLIVLLSWLLCKRKHIMKFAKLYMERDFDVLTVSISPWQLMWPVQGSRITAADLLTFLHKNTNYQHVVLHGFSVGGYMWGEVLDLIHSDQKKYNHVIDRIAGQVWDSAVDVNELSIGTPRAVFPTNAMLQSVLQKYLEYHMKAFYKQSTQYYVRSSQLFHTTPVRAPALLLLSDTDPIGTVTSNTRAHDSWQSLGIKTYQKVFKGSPHVGHFQMYPKEYVAELYAFLDKLQFVQNKEKIRARL
ncbi:uncharacterized protein LOC105703938 [Orussus abietinus]|uniref:uncharacterized protein LOC105703938 n=1 Tax=Orussus abietinus TaxID=222816 RepID=UPI000625B37B|nr:uncharacterized protein LOC105703938 [Orussus abietinus]XP_012288162.1 uncharacterized protein LOC105703938 [Orussus abietinus]XP_012288164.1 uncharacterized protein LOC105703938 [Orussus abietinus]XP_012288165.1 uncharacterized protein LOC105703938 [Orussus abietinus]XP_012288166.1 uncharacterized protein LOC105703938 [Orussus abietinus]XP_012288167.1 uncharacterized protein LOC105703938 [Orussus abietinus]